MKKWTGFITAAVIVVSSCKAQPAPPVLAEQPDGHTLLWEMTGKGLKQPSYIFGTIHLLCKDDIKLSAALKQALTYSQELYLELDMDDPSTLLGGMLLMNMQDGKTLKDLYTPQEYDRLKKYFKDSLRMGLQMLERMKPAMASSMLFPAMMPCKTTSSVEEQLMRLVKPDKKEVKGLETMAFQASIFDSVPYDVQAKELLKTIDSIQLYKKYFSRMVNAYKNQQTDTLESFFTDTAFGMMESGDILLTNRNRNWVKQLLSITKKKHVFVAVGAAHLLGKDGLVSLLRKEGYTVRPLVNR